MLNVKCKIFISDDKKSAEQKVCDFINKNKVQVVAVSEFFAQRSDYYLDESHRYTLFYREEKNA